jgi:hypothetical protein
MHELRAHREEIEGASDRSFGQVMAVAALVIAGILWWHGARTSFTVGAVAIGAAFGLLARLVPKLLAPLNWLWTRLGLLLFHVVSPVAVGLLFYLSVAPIGLAFRLLGKDPLRLKRRPDDSSYWISRPPTDPAANSMNNQF